jgi:hypothetical protein
MCVKSRAQKLFPISFLLATRSMRASSSSVARVAVRTAAWLCPRAAPAARCAAAAAAHSSSPPPSAIFSTRAFSTASSSSAAEAAAAPGSPAGSAGAQPQGAPAAEEEPLFEDPRSSILEAALRHVAREGCVTSTSTSPLPLYPRPPPVAPSLPSLPQVVQGGACAGRPGRGVRWKGKRAPSPRPHPSPAPPPLLPPSLLPTAATRPSPPACSLAAPWTSCTT